MFDRWSNKHISSKLGTDAYKVSVLISINVKPSLKIITLNPRMKFANVFYSNAVTQNFSSKRLF